MYRDRAVPGGGPGIVRPCGPARADLAAVLFYPSLLKVAEEFLRDSGERLHPLAVKSEDVVGTDEVDTEESVPCVLDAVRGCVREAREMSLALALCEVLDGRPCVSGTCGEPGCGCASAMQSNWCIMRRPL